MRNGLAGSIAAVYLALTPVGAAAQVRPRAPDGKPDLQGIWQALNTASWDIQDHNARLGVPAGRGIVVDNEIPYQPWALARRQENFTKRSTADPEAKGYLPGVPRVMYMPFPFQIFQTPTHVSDDLRVCPCQSDDLYERHTTSSRPDQLVARRFARTLGG